MAERQQSRLGRESRRWSTGSGPRLVAAAYGRSGPDAENMTECTKRLGPAVRHRRVYKCRLPTASVHPLPHPRTRPYNSSFLLPATPMTTVAVQVPIAAQTLIWDPSIEYWPLYDQCGRWNVQLNRVEIYQCIRARACFFLLSFACVAHLTYLFFRPYNTHYQRSYHHLVLAPPSVLLTNLRASRSNSHQIPPTGDSLLFGETYISRRG